MDTALFSDDTKLHQRLAHLSVEMELQPDATNQTDHDIVSSDSTEEFPELHTNVMKPGEAIVEHDGSRYFVDLPEYQMDIGYFFEGVSCNMGVFDDMRC